MNNDPTKTVLLDVGPWAPTADDQATDRACGRMPIGHSAERIQAQRVEFVEESARQRAARAFKMQTRAGSSTAHARQVAEDEARSVLLRGLGTYPGEATIRRVMVGIGDVHTR
jgi:hypothetical protein